MRRAPPPPQPGETYYVKVRVQKPKPQPTKYLIVRPYRSYRSELPGHFLTDEETARQNTERDVTHLTMMLGSFLTQNDVRLLRDMLHFEVRDRLTDSDLAALKLVADAAAERLRLDFTRQVEKERYRRRGLKAAETKRQHAAQRARKAGRAPPPAPPPPTIEGFAVEIEDKAP